MPEFGFDERAPTTDVGAVRHHGTTNESLMSSPFCRVTFTLETLSGWETRDGPMLRNHAGGRNGRHNLDRGTVNPPAVLGRVARQMFHDMRSVRCCGDQLAQTFLAHRRRDRMHGPAALTGATLLILGLPGAHRTAATRRLKR
jgi:hypothetical protein